MATLDRHTILDALEQALRPRDHVHAMWQGGAAAFQRVDDYSDIDVQFAVDDERVDEVLAEIKGILAGLSPIVLEHVLPQPTWHGHAQALYLLRDTSPFLMVDLVVMKLSAESKFLEPEMHGELVVHFDKSEVIRPEPFDEKVLADKLRARLETLRTTFDLFQILTLKEVHRGNDLEAHTYYHHFTLRPLIELLRIHHKPVRHGFHLRDIQYDLPRELVDRLRPLVFVTDLDDIERKRALAEEWFNEAFATVSLEGLSRRL